MDFPEHCHSDPERRRCEEIDRPCHSERSEESAIVCIQWDKCRCFAQDYSPISSHLRSEGEGSRSEIRILARPFLARRRVNRLHKLFHRLLSITLVTLRPHRGCVLKLLSAFSDSESCAQRATAEGNSDDAKACELGATPGVFNRSPQPWSSLYTSSKATGMNSTTRTASRQTAWCDPRKPLQSCQRWECQKSCRARRIEGDWRD